MKNFKIGIASLAFLSLVACNFSASASKDFMTGITLLGNGITAEKVYLTDGNEGLKTRTFKYGQKVYTNFEGLSGFTIEDGKYYPDMSVWVVSKKGDTIMNYNDLYSGKGVAASETTLNSHVILANPIKSDMEYTIGYRILDAKGDGHFFTKMDMKVVPDASIEILKSGLDLEVAYLMNEDTQTVITDNTMTFNQNVYLNFQGLSGYTVIDNQAEVGLKVKVTDSNGTTIVDEADIFKGQRIHETELQTGLASTLVMTPGSVSNPLKWEVEIWDKNSKAKLNAVTEISVVR